MIWRKRKSKCFSLLENLEWCLLKDWEELVIFCYSLIYNSSLVLFSHSLTPSPPTPTTQWPPCASPNLTHLLISFKILVYKICNSSSVSMSHKREKRENVSQWEQKVQWPRMNFRYFVNMLILHLNMQIKLWNRCSL